MIVLLQLDGVKTQIRDLVRPEERQPLPTVYITGNEPNTRAKGL